MKLLGSKIKEYRISAMKTEPEVAHGLGLPVAMFQKLELGKHNVKYGRLQRLSDSLQTNPINLLSSPPKDQSVFDAQLLLAKLENKHWQRKLLRQIV
jgi:transcriptional regulator with XRE-family HTH domain